jgi:hypothetical protein
MSLVFDRALDGLAALGVALAGVLLLTGTSHRDAAALALLAAGLGVFRLFRYLDVIANRKEP